MTKFWNLDSLPLNENGHEYLRRHFINGQVEAKPWLPSVICPKCKDWGFYAHFPFKCPEKIKQIPAIVNGVPIPLAEYRELVPVVQKELEAAGIDSKLWMLDPNVGFRPGSVFADRIMEIPCHPSLSFYEGRDAITSKAVKDAFEKEKFSGVFFQEAKLNWVGKFDITTKEPSWDHMMWWNREGCLIGSEKEYPGEENPEDFGPIYGMIVWNWASHFDIEKEYPHCKTCGRELRPAKSIKGRKFLKKHQVLDFDMFRVPGIGLVVSDRVREVIKENGFTNCDLKELSIL